MFFDPLRRFFAPAPHVPRLPPEEVARRYPIERLNILTATYFGYAVFYLVRNNLGSVAKDVEGALHYDHTMVGVILGASAASYGIGKFLMGSLSDRSDPRKFMACGLLLTALCNVAFGSVASYPMHVALWSLNGAIQGMGWPPCGRSIGHWFSVRERGTVFSIWNTATNVGGGLAGVIATQATKYCDWQCAFYFPAAIAALGAVYLFWRLRDTPQSVGLPPIEEYRDDYTAAEKLHGTQERELTARELFVDNILKNKYVWIFAAANFFVYIARYCMIDWGPTYLRDVKGANLEMGGYAVLVLEWSGIPSTLLMGWLSDKMGGRRGMVSLLCLGPTLFALVVLFLTPAGHLWLDYLMLAMLGFFVYPPVMLLALVALDLTSKKAVGTAAGFIGMFGYLGRTTLGAGVGWIVDFFGRRFGLETGWNVAIGAVILCTLIAIGLLSFTWRVRPKG
ncbi:MAG: MFS transporter [Pirellulales bacterium]|nr:MFS transporter [Pirellulales bacterium]